MILSDSEILKALDTQDIVIQPFHRSYLGSNSYDVHLSLYLATYRQPILDAKRHNDICTFIIPDEGYILQPQKLYLASTQEYTETHKYVPFLEGKSSTGRLGICIHATAGKGDVGFCNHWTLEISVTQPVKVYAGMPIAQLIYFKVAGKVLENYSQKSSAKYAKKTEQPIESMMWKNFSKEKN